MFGFLDPFTQRVNDQIAAYAAAQSDIVRRAWAAWFDPFQILRPVRIQSDRPVQDARRRHAAGRPL